MDSNKEQNEKYLAIIVKKYKLNKDTYICNCAGEDFYKIGYYDKENDCFYDENNTKYLSMHDYAFLETDVKYAVSQLVSLNELCYLYGYSEAVLNEGLIKKIVQAYYEDHCNNVSIVFDDLNGEIFSYTASLDDIYDYVYSIVGESEKSSCDECENNEELLEITKQVVAGEYSLKELDELLNKLSQDKDNYDENEYESLVDTIHLQMEASSKGESSVQLKNDGDLYRNLNLINIKDVYDKVRKTVVAQDGPVLDLISEIASLDMSDNKEDCILITGSTGVGKTKTMKLIAKYLDRPFLMIDSTQLTAPGYVGKDIEEYLYDLLKSCDFNIEKTQKAIVYFDEIDKKGSSDKSDIGGQAVLNVLLKFMDGVVYDACESVKSIGFNPTYKIDTTNMIVIAGGAFADLYDNRFEKNIRGFSDKNLYSEIKSPSVDDFIEKSQMTKEFMGRCSTVIHFNDFTKDHFVKLLEKSDESPMELERVKFKKLDIDIKFTTDYKDAVAMMAVKRHTGVRGLRGIVKESTRKSFREVNMNLGEYSELIISSETAKDNKNYQLVKKKKTK